MRLSTKASQYTETFNQFYLDHYKIKDPKALYQPVKYIMDMGGKRFRPLLLLLAHDTRKTPNDHAFELALGIEMFHNFTLMHDDIMDNSEIRRGHAAVHKKYGLNSAILSGDVMLIEATKLISQVAHETQNKILLDRFLKTAQEICEGQQYDVNFETADQVSLADYIKMIQLKTAVLLGYASYAGCTLAGYSSDFAEAAYKFTVEAGITFQIWDDYLDVFAPETSGKRLAGDIYNHKETFLIIQLKESIKGEDRDAFQKLWAKDSFEKTEVDQIIHWLSKYKVDEYCRTYVEDRFEQAKNAIAATDEFDAFKTVVDFCATFIRRDK